ncbi:MAG TPA: hypothetical protein VGM51_09495 [Armatimonadota bacterium]
MPLELAACTPDQIDPNGFNPHAVLPYGLTTNHVASSLCAFTDFLGYINKTLNTNGIERLEVFMMPANFSSLVGEFMGANLPKHCSGVVRNLYHNGHPDLIPRGRFPRDSVQYAHEGIEIKASRYSSSWQGHNAECSFLMIFTYTVNKKGDKCPMSFRFDSVFAAQLEEEDWSFQGRIGDSRRTPTASIIKSGLQKLKANWVYRAGQGGSR